jgi:hypothetical protein
LRLIQKTCEGCVLAPCQVSAEAWVVVGSLAAMAGVECSDLGRSRSKTMLIYNAQDVSKLGQWEAGKVIVS